MPKAPQRFYYKFGRPVRTSREDQNNPERVQQLYQEVRLKPVLRAAHVVRLQCGIPASAQHRGRRQVQGLIVQQPQAYRLTLSLG